MQGQRSTDWGKFDNRNFLDHSKFISVYSSFCKKSWFCPTDKIKTNLAHHFLYDNQKRNAYGKRATSAKSREQFNAKCFTCDEEDDTSTDVSVDSSDYDGNVSVNPFLFDVSFSYPPKASEKYGFLVFSQSIKREHREKWVKLINILLGVYKKFVNQITFNNTFVCEHHSSCQPIYPKILSLEMIDILALSHPTPSTNEKLFLNLIWLPLNGIWRHL